MLPFQLLLLISTVCGYVLESLAEIPEGWKRVGSADPKQQVRLHVAMNPPKRQLFEETLLAISDPGNQRYGQYLKRDELKGMMRPTAEATACLIDWLLQAGVERKMIAEDGEWVVFITPVQIANALLNTTFVVYENFLGERRTRSLQYSIPAALYGYIGVIQPTTRFGEVYHRQTDLQRQLGAAPGASSELLSPRSMSIVTPATLQYLYNLPISSSIEAATAGRMATTNFFGEFPRSSDLDTFVKDYFPVAHGANFTWESINGGETDQSLGHLSTEANLGLQYLVATGWPVEVHTYTTGGKGLLVPDLDQPYTNRNEPYLEFLTLILAQDDEELPHTISISYGENEQSVPEGYRMKVCDMFGQLGARGVSVIVASGDTGVGSACQTNDGKNKTRFLPMFPASCPYVTSVGGTIGVDPERAVAFSSGGFSDTWARPPWQENAVTTFLDQLGGRWEGLYNKTGRGYPDVAAQANNVRYIDQGQQDLLSGTSASAPIFAGIVARLNAERRIAGKATLGFLNPWIYSGGFTGFTDIVDGGSGGCTGTSAFTRQAGTAFVPYASWNATVGWDPVTGYGTPDYEKLLPLVLALP